MEVSRVQTLILLLIAPAVVQSKSATIKQSYRCRIESQRYVHVRTPSEGRLAAILVKEGQAVKRGDLLFQVRPPKDKEKPEAENRDEVVSIEAPCDGLVVGRLPSLLGSRARKGESLATLSDDSKMWVHFDMPERHYLAFMTGGPKDWRTRKLELILADHSKYPHAGKIIKTLGSFHNTTGDITFVAEFPNPDGVLHRGQTGTLSMNRALKDASSSLSGRRSKITPSGTFTSSTRHIMLLGCGADFQGASHDDFQMCLYKEYMKVGTEKNDEECLEAGWVAQFKPERSFSRMQRNALNRS